MRTLSNDPKGTALFLEREASRMHPRQVFRELVQNSFEARASWVLLDGYTVAGLNHHMLARVTDNGEGMDEDKLLQRLSTLHVQSKGEGNFGLGARIAALPLNPAGVSYASRTLANAALVTLHKENDEFGIKVWDTTEPDGTRSRAEAVEPDEGELERLRDKTGTAVILHGDGTEPTWSPAIADRVHRYLAERYFTFPNDVRVQTRSPDEPRSRLVVPYEHLLANYKAASGTVTFSNVSGLSGRIRWWLLKEERSGRNRSGRLVRPNAGVGLLVDQEIFSYGVQYLEDFGVWLKTAKRRVAILIEIDGAAMDSARASLYFPRRDGDRQNVPWKALGHHFVQNMPPEIEALTKTPRTSEAAIDKSIADRLDREWWKKLGPIRTRIPDKSGEPSIGESNEGESSRPLVSDARERAERSERAQRPKEPASTRTRRPAVGRRTGSGDKPGRWGERVVLPTVEFVDIDEFPDVEHPYLITWARETSTVLVCDQFPPYVREVGRWVEETSLPRKMVEAAVRQACRTEYAAMIIDANGQDKHGLEPHLVQQLKEDNVLYGKVLGRVSLPALIKQYLDEAQKEVG